MSDLLVQVDDANFATKVLGSEKPVLVDFWATWCRPCLMMAPIFEEFAGEYKDKLVFAKMDIDANQQTPGELGIQSIPTLVFFHHGREVNRIVGLGSRDMLRRQIDQALAAAV